MPSSMAAPLMDDFCEHFDRVVSNNQVGVVSDIYCHDGWVNGVMELGGKGQCRKDLCWISGKGPFLSVVSTCYSHAYRGMSRVDFNHSGRLQA